MNRMSALGLAAILSSVVGCAGSNASSQGGCGPGRTMLDGVCVSEQVADYVACVRAQGAQVGSASSSKLSAEAGAFGVKAGGAREVSEQLEKKYSASDAAMLKIIETCDKAASERASSGPPAPSDELRRAEWSGTRYARVERTMSWHQAKDACERLGAKLVSITSAEENKFVYEEFGKDAVLWLGATDERSEGRFQWVSGEPFGYANWNASEPNNSGGAEHYLTMGDFDSKTSPGVYFHFGATWNDMGATGEIQGERIAKPMCEFPR